MDVNGFYCEYDKLAKMTDEILPYYDVDKIKPYSVYIWTKGDGGQNVFDIQADKIIFYEEHSIIEDAKPIIEKIQSKLKEIESISKK